MNRKTDDEKIAEMKAHVEEKYGQDFTVEYFLSARDSTYTNILTLSDGEKLFNVYKYDDDSDITDDYPRSVLRKKFSEYIRNNEEYGLKNTEFYVHLMLSGNRKYTYEYYADNDIEDILSENEILKIILIIKTGDDIAEQKEKIFVTYKGIVALDPRVIDFVVIHEQDNNEKLMKTLNNLSAYYDNEWDKFKSIKSYIMVTDKNITSADALVKGVK